MTIEYSILKEVERLFGKPTVIEEYSVLKEVERLFSKSTVTEELQQYWTPETFLRNHARNEDNTRFCITGTISALSPLPKELRQRLNTLLCKSLTDEQMRAINQRYRINWKDTDPDILNYKTVAYYDKNNYKNKVCWPAINDVFGYDAVIDVLTFMESGVWVRQ